MFVERLVAVKVESIEWSFTLIVDVVPESKQEVVVALTNDFNVFIVRSLVVVFDVLVVTEEKVSTVRTFWLGSVVMELTIVLPRVVNLATICSASALTFIWVVKKSLTWILDSVPCETSMDFVSTFLEDRPAIFVKGDVTVNVLFTYSGPKNVVDVFAINELTD